MRYNTIGYLYGAIVYVFIRLAIANGNRSKNVMYILQLTLEVPFHTHWKDQARINHYENKESVEKPNISSV